MVDLILFIRLHFLICVTLWWKFTFAFKLHMTERLVYHKEYFIPICCLSLHGGLAMHEIQHYVYALDDKMEKWGFNTV